MAVAAAAAAVTRGSRIVDALLDDIERGGNGPFFGPHVAAAVRESKYRYLWRPLIERYKELATVASDGVTMRKQIYGDLACTLITKKVLIVDMDYLYESGPDEEQDVTRLREAHMIMARRYLMKMLNCVYECLHGRPCNGVDVTNAAVLLYAEVYAEAFDPVSVREPTVFELVQRWFGAHVMLPVVGETYRNVAPGGPFLHCSHAYWLWLHLTAAKVSHNARDLLTVIYALDTVVYCDACRMHFLQLKTDFFVDVRENDGLTDCYCRYTNDTLLFKLHNRVNAAVGHADADETVLSDYRDFWRLADAKT